MVSDHVQYPVGHGSAHFILTLLHDLEVEHAERVEADCHARAKPSGQS